MRRSSLSRLLSVGAAVEFTIVGMCFLRYIFVVLLLWSNLESSAALCPDSLYTTNIAATSAILHWRKAKPWRRVLDYKVLCAGVCHYTTAEGAPATDIDRVERFAPEGVDHVLLGNLQPNFNYSCVVTMERGRGVPTPSKPHLFSTHYAAPPKPKGPVIHQSDNRKQLSIEVFPTSSVYGPISGYEVQFHVLDKEALHMNGLPYIPTQFLKPHGPLSTLKKTQKAFRPVSFCITYTSQNLPATITIGSELLQGALKNGTSYSVVTVAYTESQQKENGPTTLLFSSSRPSYPFTAIGHGVQSEADSARKHRRHISASVILGVLFPTAVILYACCIGAFITYRELVCPRRYKKLYSLLANTLPLRNLERVRSHVERATILEDSPHPLDTDLSPQHTGHYQAPVLPWHPFLPARDEKVDVSTSKTVKPNNSKDASAILELVNASIHDQDPEKTSSITHTHSSGAAECVLRSAGPTEDHASVPSLLGSSVDLTLLSQPSELVRATEGTEGLSEYYSACEWTGLDVDSRSQNAGAKDKEGLFYTCESTPMAPTAFQSGDYEQQINQRVCTSEVTDNGERYSDGLEPSEVGVKQDQSNVSVSGSSDPALQLQPRASSRMFLPRGLSCGPYPMVTRPGSHAVHHVRAHAQLSFASSLGQQSDQAPELELDLYDLVEPLTSA